MINLAFVLSVPLSLIIYACICSIDVRIAVIMLSIVIIALWGLTKLRIEP